MKVLAGLIAGATSMLAFSSLANAFTMFELPGGSSPMAVANSVQNEAYRLAGAASCIAPNDNASVNLTTSSIIYAIDSPNMDLSSLILRGASEDATISLFDSGLGSLSPGFLAFDAGVSRRGTISHGGIYDFGNRQLAALSLTGSGSITGLDAFGDRSRPASINPDLQLSFAEINNITRGGGYGTTGFDREISVTPEPGSILLFGSGLTCLALYGRKRTKGTR